LVQGYVHDQGAALLGGVAGHAGLFSSANDLAKLMQMYMQKGHYAGLTYFDSVTVNEFIRCQYCITKNRRGIGFDKPQLEGPGPTCGCISDKSFGHSGFTGTLAWADPEEQIVYIFLSNRVYPDAENRKLLSLSTRTKIQEVIYDAIKSPEPASELLGMAP
jgi:beta-N-acetylhexosaminidase